MKNQSFFSFNSDVDVHGSVTKKKKLPSAKKKKATQSYTAQLRGGKKKSHLFILT